MEHNWNINNLERELINGLVTTASYCCTSNHDGYGNRELGEIALPYLAPSEEDFIPYGSLDEVVVLSWVSNLINTSSIELVASSSIAERINADNDKVYIEGLPWE